jgi:hypothetical protein
VGQQHAAVDLVGDGLAVNDVQRGAVGQLDLLERVLLGQDLVDDGRQERVGGQQRLADGPLDGGFELLFGAAVESA